MKLLYRSICARNAAEDDCKTDDVRREGHRPRNRVRQLYQKVTDILSEQQKLHQISDEAFSEDTFEIDEARYKKIQSDITNRIMEFQEQILSLEVQTGLDSLEEIDSGINDGSAGAK